jgi:hypothetical protein
MSEYGKVALTLSNVVLPADKLYPNPTPSTSEGLPWDVEYDLRLIGCELIQTACLLLKLPQVSFERSTNRFLIRLIFRQPLQLVKYYFIDIFILPH